MYANHRALRRMAPHATQSTLEQCEKASKQSEALEKQSECSANSSEENTSCWGGMEVEQRDSTEQPACVATERLRWRERGRNESGDEAGRRPG